MKIYLDYIFLENIVVNLMINLGLLRFLKVKVKKINFILGIVLISFYTTLLNIEKISNSILSTTLLKLIIIIISIYIIYIPKNFVTLAKYLAYYISFEFMYLGIIMALSIIFKLNLENIVVKIIVYIASAVLLYIFVLNMWKLWKSKIHFSDLIYEMEIYGINILGFVDTGNTVKEKVTNLDVIFIDKSYFLKFEKILNNLTMVNLDLKTVNSKSTTTGYIARSVTVKKKDKEYVIQKVIICFADNSFSHKKYNALIGYNTYIDDLGGIEFC